MPPTAREQVYQTYLDFLETAENKRNWNIFKDIPWDRLDPSKATEEVGRGIEMFCAEEMYVPDYSSSGLDLTRSQYGLAWFLTRWAFEESRHALVLREYLTRSGLRSPEQFEALETLTFSSKWQLPFPTSRQMLCYGAVQEAATFTSYHTQRNRARGAGDEVLETIFFLIGRDEAAHAGFYRALIQVELAENRAETIADLAHVLSNFKMPGDGLIPDYWQRLQGAGLSITTRTFIRRVAWPLITTLGINRDEIRLGFKNEADAA